MTPAQAAHILEPLWVGLEAALERLHEATAAASAEACATPGGSTLKELFRFYQAEDFLLAFGRRMDAEYLDAVALDLGNGKAAFWPCMVNPQAQRDAVERWLAKNPKVRAAREARRKAWKERLDRAAADLRKVTPLRPAAPAVEPLPVAGGVP